MKREYKKVCEEKEEGEREIGKGNGGVKTERQVWKMGVVWCVRKGEEKKDGTGD